MDRVFNSALSLFSEHGFEKATISLIARHAKVSAATIYRRFPDKGGLLYAILEVWSQARTDDFDKSWHDLTRGKRNPVEILEIFIEIVFSAYRNDSGLLRLIEERAITDPVVKIILSNMIKHSALRLHQKLSESGFASPDTEIEKFISNIQIMVTGSIRSLMLWGAMSPWGVITIFDDTFRDFILAAVIARLPDMPTGTPACLKGPLE